ncbi:hypothetical protein H9L39_03472 [Fusarium oxysporum f. sp. albedinis]|nr:hypothetical protein H9L39_03472 [Fusarium oxysporum f. sp. albedinis]
MAAGFANPVTFRGRAYLQLRLEGTFLSLFMSCREIQARNAVRSGVRMQGLAPGGSPARDEGHSDLTIRCYADVQLTDALAYQ